MLSLASSCRQRSFEDVQCSEEVTYDEFKDLYYRHGERMQGITTFRAAGKRYGILNEANDNEPEERAEACFINPETGQKECE